MKAELVIPGDIVVALAGNPNSGKTTVFNSLTGARQHVGNWPGVTVEKKEGQFSVGGKVIRVVDLPGTYSLDAYSADEAVARDYILFEQPDVVVNIVDATNLERNLYLTVQMMEMGANVVVALNMCDEAKAQEIDIDIDKLSKMLGVPVVPTVATRKQGMEEVVKAALQAAENRRKPLRINYGKKLESKLSALEQEILLTPWLANKYNPRWLAVKLLEGGEENLFASHPEIYQLFATGLESANDSESCGDDAESLIIDCRYSFINGIAKETVKKEQTTKLSISDRIDRVVTNRYLGIPIFLMAMWLLFQFTFALGEPLVAVIESFFAWEGDFVSAGLDSLGISALIKSLIVDGFVKGLGSILVFIPNIFLLFFAISLLEDSGYMARAAYIMDRFMHTLGLHGKSFIPLLIGFGCNVPAIMATRTLENKKDRMVTILISPLISCSARLPVYLLFAGAFFSAYRGLVVFSLYLLGIVLAVVMGMVFKRLFFKGETSHFVMELPPYRVPTLKSTLIHMWEKIGRA
ncbi:MAG: ferrous iron transport protein B, partial [Eubacteriales bacterium]|nr:ferrous iron transport protein B [Eubacteriales bacterium]